MAIEGPLRELGIHDVFQLLDLSRKTGRLRVTSALRDNEGTVDFHNGRVVAATIRSNPHPIGQLLVRAGKVTEEEIARARALQAARGERRRLGELLVEIGALTERELRRQVRHQIEAVVFELMSWQEGYFSFAEGDVHGAPAELEAALSTEALLMEAARRIDEWTRIADRVPSLDIVPVLAPAEEGRATALELLPVEWEVLAAVDGVTDLRTIASIVSVSEFDVARIVYGLHATGVLALCDPRLSASPLAHDEAATLLAEARQAMRRGDLARAIDCWQRVIVIDPASSHAEHARDALTHARRLNTLVGVGDAG